MEAKKEILILRLRSGKFGNLNLNNDFRFVFYIKIFYSKDFN